MAQNFVKPSSTTTSLRPALDYRLNSHYESLSRLIRLTRVADAKAAPILGLQVALAGTLGARFDRLEPLITPTEWSLEQIAWLVVAVTYGLFTASTVVFATWVYMPRNPKTKMNIVIYFEDIAAMDYQQFRRAAKMMQAVDVEDQLLDQVHRVSEVVSTKMKKVRVALWLSLPAAFLWVLLLAYSTGNHIPDTVNGR